jgi:hypothetical protein
MKIMPKIVLVCYGFATWFGISYPHLVHADVLDMFCDEVVKNTPDSDYPKIKKVTVAKKPYCEKRADRKTRLVQPVVIKEQEGKPDAYYAFIAKETSGLMSGALCSDAGLKGVYEYIDVVYRLEREKNGELLSENVINKETCEKLTSPSKAKDNASRAEFNKDSLAASQQDSPSGPSSRVEPPKTVSAIGRGAYDIQTIKELCAKLEVAPNRKGIAVHSTHCELQGSGKPLLVQTINFDAKILEMLRKEKKQPTDLLANLKWQFCNENWDKLFWLPWFDGNVKVRVEQYGDVGNFLVNEDSCGKKWNPN